MNRVKIVFPLFVFVGTLISAPVMANCAGNVYSMNAGRGHVGLLLDLQEREKMNDIYTDAQERTFYRSKALFSATSMSYDPISERLYYASAPEPISYHVNGYANDTSEEEFNSLNLHAKTLKPHRLAYFDPATGNHVLGPNTLKQIFRMAFEPNTGELFASDANSIFKVDPITGLLTHLRNFDLGLVRGGFTSWGDFVFQDGELLFITNQRSFVIDTTTGVQTLKGFHFSDFITSATLDQNGQLLISAKNQNVSGNMNSNILYRLNAATGEKKQVGLFPSRISAMGTVTSEYHTCYDKTLFPSELKPEVATFSADASSITEGMVAYFTASFDRATLDTHSKIHFALINGTAALNSDFYSSASLLYSDGTTSTASISSSGTEIPLPKGINSVRIGIASVNDAVHENTEYFQMQSWMNTDKSDAISANINILDNDPDVDAQLRAAVQNSGVAWHGSRGGHIFTKDQWIRGVHANISGTIPAGTILEFYKTGGVLRSMGISYGGTYYEQNANHERYYEGGDVAWARLKGPNGQYYNLKTGHRAQLHWNKNVNCSNGCWSKIHN